MAPNYANGKIYCIRNDADNDRIVYVGSTVRPLSERMTEHRGEARKQRNNMKIYAYLAEVGIEHFHIELLVDFPCERREQMLAEEGRHIRLHNVGFNKTIAGRTMKEYDHEQWANITPEEKARAYEQQRIYYQTPEGKARRNEYQNVWRKSAGPKERIAAYMKLYYERKKAERLNANVG